VESGAARPAKGKESARVADIFHSLQRGRRDFTAREASDFQSGQRPPCSVVRSPLIAASFDALIDWQPFEIVEIRTAILA